MKKRFSRILKEQEAMEALVKMLQMQMNCRGAENVQMCGIIVKGLEGDGRGLEGMGGNLREWDGI